MHIFYISLQTVSPILTKFSHKGPWGKPVQNCERGVGLAPRFHNFEPASQGVTGRSGQTSKFSYIAKYSFIVVYSFNV